MRFSHLEDVWDYLKLRNILDIITLIIRHSTDRSWLAIVHKLKFDSMKCLLTMNEHEFSLAFIRWMDIWSCLFLTGRNSYRICTLEWNVLDICISRTIDIFLEFHYFKLHDSEEIGIIICIFTKTWLKYLNDANQEQHCTFSIMWHENQRIVLIVCKYVCHRRPLPSAAVSFLVCRGEILPLQ